MLNNVLIIPKGLAQKGELVVIPRVEYEEYLSLKKIIPLVKLSKAEKKQVEQGRKQIQNGQFLTLNALKHELGY